MRSFFLLLYFLAASGCSTAADSADDTSSDSAETGDAQGSCTDLCTTAGFASGTAEEFEHELNCTCAGGSGAVGDAECADMCVALEWAGGATYSSTGGAVDSCQCS